MHLSWEFFLRDLIPLASAQFFVVFLIYFTVVRQRIGPVFPYYVAFLVGLIVFMGGAIFRLYPTPHSDDINLYIRFATLFTVGLPSLTIAAGMQTGRKMMPRLGIAAYVFGFVCALLYVGLRDAVHGCLVWQWLGFSQAQMESFGFEGKHAHLVQLTSIVVTLLLPSVWFLIKPSTEPKPLGLLWSMFSLAFFLTLGTATEEWWIYYAGSAVSALILGTVVFKDVLRLKQGAEHLVQGNQKLFDALNNKGIESGLGDDNNDCLGNLKVSSLPMDETVVRARDYIKSHFKEDIGIDDVAQALNVSRSHLMGVFKKMTATTVNQYLIDLRMAEARTLLLTKSVTEVAFEVGFNSSNYFSTVFKKQNQITPKQYQELHRVA